MKRSAFAAMALALLSLDSSASELKDTRYVSPMNFGLHALSVLNQEEQVRLIVGPALLSYNEGTDFAENQKILARLSTLFGMERVGALVIDVGRNECAAHSDRPEIFRCATGWPAVGVTVRGATLGWSGEILTLSENAITDVTSIDVGISEVSRLSVRPGHGPVQSTELEARADIVLNVGAERIALNLSKAPVNVSGQGF